MKTHWLIFLMVAGVFSSTRSVFAAEENSGQHWTRVTDLRSKYVGGMTGARIVDEPVIQPSMTLNHENCYANVWASLHMADTSHVRKGDEIDFSGGCSVSWGSVRHNLSLTYYNLYPMNSVYGDLFGVKDAMVFPKIAGFTPSLSLEWDIPENRAILPGGVVYKAEFARDVSVGGNRAIGTVAFGGHDGAYGVKREVVSFVRLGIAWPLRAGSTSVTPSLMLQHGMGRGGMAGNEVLFNLNISW
jgi:hypothetical protein